jgi:hypothetical protein
LANELVIKNGIKTPSAEVTGTTVTVGSVGPTGNKGSLVLKNGDDSYTATVQPSTSQSADLTLTLPPGAGTNGQVLQTDGSGALSWTTPSSGGSSDGFKFVRVATTTSGTLASAFENGDTVDGITIATGDKILIKNQSTASENGIYTVNASGAPTRTTDYNTDSEIRGSLVLVMEGTVNKHRIFQNTNTTSITIDSTSITYDIFRADISTVADNDVDTGTEVLDSFSDSLSKACRWDYVIDNGPGTNMRAGVIVACWNTTSGSTPAYYETETLDIGDTSGVTFTVDKSTNTIQLNITVGSDNWAIRTQRYLI